MFFDLSSKNQQGAVDSAVQLEATINFDTADLNLLVIESDRGILEKIGSYRTLMQETLNESAGVINEDACLIMEQANEHVGQKIIKALQAFWNWLTKTASDISAKLQSMVTSNKKLIQKLKPEVQEKLSKLSNEEKGKITAELYDYDLDVIDLRKFVTGWNSLYKGGGGDTAYDLTSDYTEASKEKLDQAVKAVAKLSHDDIAHETLKLIYKGAKNKTLSEAKQEAVLLLRKGGKRTTKKFDMKYFDTVEHFDQVKSAIDKYYAKVKDIVKSLIQSIQSKAGKAPKGDDHAGVAFHSGLIAYYNAKRKILMGALSVAISMSNLKLAAAREQMNSARQFCLHASRIKVQNESAVEPFDPMMEAYDETDETGSEDKDSSLEESDQFAW